MTIRAIFSGAVTVFALMTVIAVTPSIATAGDGVLQVVAVRVNDGKLDDYLAKVKQLEEISTRLGVESTIQVWQATMAGDATGTVVVGLEFPSLAAFAEGSAKMQADEEWSKLIGSLSGMRTIVSQSLYQDITP